MEVDEQPGTPVTTVAAIDTVTALAVAAQSGASAPVLPGHASVDSSIGSGILGQQQQQQQQLQQQDLQEQQQQEHQARRLWSVAVDPRPAAGMPSGYTRQLQQQLTGRVGGAVVARRLGRATSALQRLDERRREARQQSGEDQVPAASSQQQQQQHRPAPPAPPVGPHPHASSSHPPAPSPSIFGRGQADFIHHTPSLAGVGVSTEAHQQAVPPSPPSISISISISVSAPPAPPPPRPILAPVSTMVEVCLAQSVQVQYRCTTLALWGLMLREFRLMDCCAALRRYFFLEHGDFSQMLVDGILSLQQNITRRTSSTHTQPSIPHAAATQQSPPANRTAAAAAPASAAAAAGCQWRQWQLLASALAGSSCADDPWATDCLGAGARVGGGGGSSSASSADGARPLSSHPTDIFQLTFQVPWPLCLVVSPHSLAQHRSITTQLLRLRALHTRLLTTWSQHNKASSVTRRPRPDPTTPQPLSRAGTPVQGGTEGAAPGSREAGGGGRGRGPAAVQGAVGGGGGAGGGEVRLWLQCALQFVSAVQEHMQGELGVGGGAWEEFRSEVEGGARDLSQLSAAHERYLAAACRTCLVTSPPPHPADSRSSTLDLDLDLEAAGIVPAAMQRALTACHTLSSMLTNLCSDGSSSCKRSSSSDGISSSQTEGVATDAKDNGSSVSSGSGHAAAARVFATMHAAIREIVVYVSGAGHTSAQLAGLASHLGTEYWSQPLLPTQ
ncbi:MAG: hypothetical protein WDW36_007665 [Sanguina aurantia]